MVQCVDCLRAMLLRITSSSFSWTNPDFDPDLTNDCSRTCVHHLPLVLLAMRHVASCAQTGKSAWTRGRERITVHPGDHLVCSFSSPIFMITGKMNAQDRAIRDLSDTVAEQNAKIAMQLQSIQALTAKTEQQDAKIADQERRLSLMETLIASQGSDWMPQKPRTRLRMTVLLFPSPALG
jgi:hypothetical protein